MSSYALRLTGAFLVVLGLHFSLHGSQNPVDSLDTVSDLLLRDEFEEAEALLRDLPDSPQLAAFEGEIAFRKGHFANARDHYSLALDREADNARAHFGLGKLALGKMRAKEAVQYLTRAVELAPDEPLYRLTAAEAWGIDKNLEEQKRQLEAYLGLEPTYNPDRVTEVDAALEVIRNFGSARMGIYDIGESQQPIQISKGINLIFANVMIGERGPFEFLVDTGASQTVFTQKLVGQLDLTPITTTLVHGIGGEGQVETSIYRIDHFTFGDIAVQNLPVGTISAPLLSEVADGIFSTATFSDHVVTIDYPQSRIEFGATEEADVDTIPSWFFNNLVLLPLTVNGIHEGLFLVDTGAVITVVSHSLAATLGVDEDTPGAQIDLSLAGVAGFGGTVLRVGDITFTTPKNREEYSYVVSIDMREISNMLGTEISGVVGYDFLENYRLTIDFQKAEVRLAR